MSNPRLLDEIRGFVHEQFPHAKSTGLGDDDSLLATGVVDSMGILEIVMYLEETFDLVLEDDEVLGDNFESIERLAAFVERKRNPIASPTEEV